MADEVLTTGDPPTVSVVMLTYRHEQYVRQAVESVLSQDLVDLEVIIGDDASPDGTAAILRELASRDSRVTLVLRDHNLGPQANFADVWSRARGEFIAVLEGDDSWTDDTKLTRQVEALRSTPAATLCFHRVSSEDAAGAPAPGSWPPPGAASFTLKRLVRGNFLATCSVMYRAGVVPSLPAFFRDLIMNDWPLHLMHTYSGGLVFVDRDMATYRYHPGGLWSGKAAAGRFLESARTLNHVARFSGPPPLVAGAIRRRARRLAATSALLGIRDRDSRAALAGLRGAFKLPL